MSSQSEKNAIPIKKLVELKLIVNVRFAFVKLRDKTYLKKEKIILCLNRITTGHIYNTIFRVESLQYILWMNVEVVCAIKLSQSLLSSTTKMTY